MIELMTIIKGFIVGAFMLVPGVSGGTMSIVFRIYDRLIEAVSGFRKHLKESILFLGQFVLGAGVAFLLLSRPVTAINRAFPLEVAFFVIGAIIAGIPILYKEAKVNRINVSVILYAAAGLLLVYIMTLLPKNVFSVDEMGLMETIIQILAGVLGSLGLILPGISFSAMLYMMGVYDFIYGNIGDRNFLVLIPFGIGMVLGILLLTKALEYCMKKYPTPTYMIILGFVIGSIGDIIKEMESTPAGAQWIICFAALIVGYFAIRFMGMLENRKEEAD